MSTEQLLQPADTDSIPPPEAILHDLGPELKLLLDTQLPLRSADQWHQIMTAYETPEADMPDLIQSNTDRELDERADVAKQLMGSPLPKHERAELLTSCVETTRIISDPSIGIMMEDVAKIVHASPNLELARSYRRLAQQWRDARILDVDTDQAFERREDFLQLLTILSRIKKPDRPTPSLEELEPDYEPIAQLYTATYEDPERFSTIRDSYIATRDRLEEPRKYCDRVFNTFRVTQAAVIHAESDPGLVQAIETSLSRYSYKEVDDKQRQGIINNLIPALATHDSQTDILRNNQAHIRSPSSGAEFVYRSYTYDISPPHLSELLSRYKLIPTFDAQRHTQNRLDGLTLSESFGNLRDAVHEQESGVHEAIEAMVHYYDSGDESVLRPAVKLFGTSVADRQSYDAEVPEQKVDVLSGHTYSSAPLQPIAQIDVLRRLEKNTQPVDDLPPATSDVDLNAYMNLLHGARTATDRRSAIEQALSHTNQMLTEKMANQAIGIQPQEVAALAWLDRACYGALHSIDFEDQWGHTNSHGFTKYYVSKT